MTELHRRRRRANDVLDKARTARPRDVWLVLGADLLSAVGSGMTLPFLVVYLTSVRGLSLGVAGAAAAAIAVAGLAGNPLGGLLTDRLGPAVALQSGLLIAGVGAFALAEAGSAGVAVASTGLSGLGVAIAWPGQDALLARLVAGAARDRIYGLRYATMNLGLAGGALVAAAVVVAGDPATFTLLYRLDAATFGLAAVAIIPIGLCGLDVDRQRSAQRPGRGQPGVGAVLRDRGMRRLFPITALLVGSGFAQFTLVLPVVAVGRAGLSPGALSLAYAANMIAVVAVQSMVLRALRGRRRTTGIMAAGLVWALTWIIVLVVARSHGAGALVAVLLAAVLFAVGECLLAPTVPAIVNDLAPERLRGRYNATSALAYTAGFAAGPALGGVVLQYGNAELLLTGAALGCGVAALAARRLAASLPAAADGHRSGSHDSEAKEHRP
ncbi:MFS transporter [Pseudonocardia sp. GCM10023141]|uniref:MFS transporter n=1 Tax=Pseudonocardia sp. GCM10023141 TaxID=3252653 RepID=UPI00360C9B88